MPPSKASENDFLNTINEKLDPNLHAKAIELYRISASHAPYLSRLIIRHPESFTAALQGLYESYYDQAIQRLSTLAQAETEALWMQAARQIKEQIALIIALADITKNWTLSQVTEALSLFADTAVQSALSFLLRDAAKRGEWDKNSTQHHQAHGITILGMGKLGAHELNYSSDIDLIILFDPQSIAYRGTRGAQIFMNKLAQQLTHLLQHRNEYGYVLRTDLRLRPDPMSTPPAVSINAALHYYETVGQNWERAAMIKARPIAGDMKTGTDFLHALIPYIWRKHLDFYMIADINSIMRQMHAGKPVPHSLYGHNIKTGVGGIRAIEFLAQTQQLVWGGRNPSLRKTSTCDALEALHHARLLDDDTLNILRDAYHYLRVLEHRLQMLEDAQTHSLPATADAMQAFALFMGFDNSHIFEQKTRHILEQVQAIYQQAMRDSAPLTAGNGGESGSLVFTGVDVDDETRQTLLDMGYKEAERIAGIIQGWHRGNRRSTRSRKARQVLTELVPTILQKLSETADPDTAFFQFDEFLNRLPSGAQIFSLIQTRPEILSFISHVLGSAKALGHTLSTNPLLLDAMMEPEFFMPLPDKTSLEEELHNRISHAQDFEQTMLLMRIFHNEKRFQAGAHMLKHLAPVQAASWFLTDLAEIELSLTLHAIIKAYYHNAPHIPHFPIAVLGFGRIGARDLTFGSDLDLVILYDDHAEEDDISADIRKHAHRLSQRFINALTSMTREGRLYEVDTRLRPGGRDGPLAATLTSFDKYFSTEAWTFEFMALTKARVIAHNHADFAHTIQEIIRNHIVKPREASKIHQDVMDMRARVQAEFGTHNPWHIKHVSGGIMDVEFIAQYLALTHAYQYPMLYQHDALSIFTQARALSLIPSQVADVLIGAYNLLSTCLSYQRLCVPGGIAHDPNMPGLFNIIAHSLKLQDAQTLTQKLLEAEATIATIMQNLHDHQQISL